MNRKVRWWKGNIVVATGLLALLVQAANCSARERYNCRVPRNNHNYYVHNGFLYLGYGMGPIPAPTVSQRLHSWQRSRGMLPQDGAVERQPGSRAYYSNEPQVETRSSSRRGYQP